MSKRDTNASKRPFFNLSTTEIARRVDLHDTDAEHIRPTAALVELAYRRKPKARTLRARIASAIGAKDVEISPKGVAYERKNAATVKSERKPKGKRPKANAPAGAKRPKLFTISAVTGRPVFASPAKVASGEQIATPESLAKVAAWDAAQNPLPPGDATATKGERKRERKARKAAKAAEQAPPSDEDAILAAAAAIIAKRNEALAAPVDAAQPTAGVWVDAHDEPVDADEAEAMDDSYRTLFGIRFSRR